MIFSKVSFLFSKITNLSLYVNTVLGKEFSFLNLAKTSMRSDHILIGSFPRKNKKF